MKNYKEITNNLLDRRERYLKMKEKKVKIITSVVLSVSCICLVAIIGLVNFKGKNLKPSNNNDIEVKWATSEDSGEEGITTWNGKNVSFRLNTALETDDSEIVYAIYARPFIDDNYTFEGKTLKDYYLDMANETNLPEKLLQLLKDGDSLKYGEELYTTGAPNGEKWVESLYNERVNFYGKELLSKYIVDGNFLKEKLEEDIKVANNTTTAQEKYKKVKNNYLNDLAKSITGELQSEVSEINDGIIIYFKKDKFASFNPNNIDEWYFDLAKKGNEQYGDDE